MKEILTERAYYKRHVHADVSEIQTPQRLLSTRESICKSFAGASKISRVRKKADRVVSFSSKKYLAPRHSERGQNENIPRSWWITSAIQTCDSKQKFCDR